MAKSVKFGTTSKPRGGSVSFNFGANRKPAGSGRKAGRGKSATGGGS